MTDNVCFTCMLAAQRERGERPLWDDIYRTRFWYVVRAYDSALPGWLVLVARRHIEALAELTPDESVELGSLITLVSQALGRVTGCVKTYVIQFAEAAGHPHVPGLRAVGQAARPSGGQRAQLPTIQLRLRPTALSSSGQQLLNPAQALLRGKPNSDEFAAELLHESLKSGVSEDS